MEMQKNQNLYKQVIALMKPIIEGCAIWIKKTKAEPKKGVGWKIVYPSVKVENV